MHGFAVIAGAVCVTIWLHLLVARGRFWMVQRLEADVVPPPETGLIAVIIPARNEAEFIAESLTSLLRQSCAGSIRIFLVDDNSTDGTAATVREAAASNACADALTVISGQALLPLGRIFEPVVIVWQQSLLTCEQPLPWRQDGKRRPSPGITDGEDPSRCPGPDRREWRGDGGWLATRNRPVPAPA